MFVNSEAGEILQTGDAGTIIGLTFFGLLGVIFIFFHRVVELG